MSRGTRPIDRPHISAARLVTMTTHKCHKSLPKICVIEMSAKMSTIANGIPTMIRKARSNAVCSTAYANGAVSRLLPKAPSAVLPSSATGGRSPLFSGFLSFAAGLLARISPFVLPSRPSRQKPAMMTPTQIAGIDPYRCEYASTWASTTNAGNAKSARTSDSSSARNSARNGLMMYISSRCPVANM